MTTTDSTSSNTALEPGTWTIDPAHSEVGFTVRHLGLSKVRGRFNDFSGTVEVGQGPADTTVTAIIELASVDTNNEQRDAHLQSADFFGVDANPQMTFRSTEVTEDTMTGDLTLNGVTKPVELDLEMNGVTIDHTGSPRAGFSAQGQIRRSDFGISFNAPVGLDGALIADKVTIELEIQITPAA